MDLRLRVEGEKKGRYRLQSIIFELLSKLQLFLIDRVENTTKRIYNIEKIKGRKRDL